MQLDCNLWLQNANGKPISRKVQGCLVLGRQAEHKGRSSKDGRHDDTDTYYLLINTRSKQHPDKIKLNKLKNIWRTMERQGKTSLEFEDPELCVFISEANPDRLHQFLAHLERATNGQPLKPVQSVKNVQQSFTAIGNRQTKMRILSNQDYPQRSSSHGFPSTLQLLHLNRIGLQAVDLRWFNLQSLRQLSLENNKLGKQWNAVSWRRFCSISRLQQLSELDLSGNPLKAIPDFFLDSLPQSLSVFLLANCQLEKLSDRISRLQHLMMLNVSGNTMEELPEDLCLLPRLNKLYLTGMPKLRFLPATLFNNSSNFNRFFELDVSHNNNSPFASSGLPPSARNSDEQQEGERGTRIIPSLCMLATAAVFNNSQYTRINGSRILRPPVQDCLPTHLHQQMGQWLARCAQCQRLYVPQSAIECFHRVQLRQFISSTLIGPSPAFVRLQLCQTCPKSLKAASRMHQIARRNVRPQQNPIPQDPFAHFRL